MTPEYLKHLADVAPNAMRRNLRELRAYLKAADLGGIKDEWLAAFDTMAGVMAPAPPEYEVVYFRRRPDESEDRLRVPLGTAEQHVRAELITRIEPSRPVGAQTPDRVRCSACICGDWDCLYPNLLAKEQQSTDGVKGGSDA